MLACNIAEKAAAARGAFAISSMAADTKTKDDWPSLLPPPPKFNVPPPPIPAFVEACRHQKEQDSTVRHYGGIYAFKWPLIFLFIFIYISKTEKIISLDRIFWSY